MSGLSEVFTFLFVLQQHADFKPGCSDASVFLFTALFRQMPVKCDDLSKWLFFFPLMHLVKRTIGPITSLALNW